MKLERSARGSSAADPVSDQVSENVEAVAAAHEQIEQATPHHQRGIVLLATTLVRPWFLFSYLSLGVAWICGNLVAHRAGLQPWDAPPFFWFQGFVTLSSLLTTMVILITQNRQGRLIAQRAHLDLQVNLLAERKITKVIELLEELRRDSPTIKNRYDKVAAAMAQPANPVQVVQPLEGKKNRVP